MVQRARMVVLAVLMQQSDLSRPDVTLLSGRCIAKLKSLFDDSNVNQLFLTSLVLSPIGVTQGESMPSMLRNAVARDQA